MNHQRGGAFQVRTFIVMALLALASFEAVALRHYMHENHILKLLILGIIDEEQHPPVYGPTQI